MISSERVEYLNTSIPNNSLSDHVDIDHSAI